MFSVILSPQTKICLDVKLVMGSCGGHLLQPFAWSRANFRFTGLAASGLLQPLMFPHKHFAKGVPSEEWHIKEIFKWPDAFVTIVQQSCGNSE